MADEGGGTPEGMVPSARLREETAAKRQAMARAAELEQQLAELEKRAATADTLAKQLEELKGKHKAERDGWESERAVYGVGITDPEAIDVARHLHQRLPEQGRPALAEWLRALKDDPTKAPKALSPYLTPAAPPADPPPAAAPPKAPPARPAGGKAPEAGPAATGSQVSAEQIRAMREEAVRTGDWSRYREARGSLGLPSLGDGKA